MRDTLDAQTIDPPPLGDRPFQWRRLVVVVVLLGLVVGGAGWILGSRSTPPSTIMGAAAPDRLVQHTDSSGVEVGTRFTVRIEGAATGMRFWKGGDGMGTHSGTLWNDQGQRMASVNFSAETDTGWQSAEFDESIRLEAGESYVVSYYAPKGLYAITDDYAEDSHTPALEILPGFGVYGYGSSSTFPTEASPGASYWVDVMFSPGATGETTSLRTAEPNQDGFAYLGRTWPDASTTGVPAGTALTPYTGPCTIAEANTVIDKKEITCDDLRIFAKGVVITNSLVHNRVYVDSSAGEGSFTISDSTVQLGTSTATGIGDVDFTALRVEVTGGNRGIACYRNCTVKDSYVVGGYADTRGLDHMSGIRVNTNSTLIHNTIGCSAPDIAPDAGCSAAITGYPDFDPVTGNQIVNNLILAGSGGYCVYGGSTAGKPFSGHAQDNVFRDNVWQTGESGRGCNWGPITSFDVNAPGNQWVNNLYEDGSTVAPAN